MMRFARILGVWMFHYGPQNENQWSDWIEAFHESADTGLDTPFEEARDPSQGDY